MVSGRDAIAQTIECRLKTFRGEWFLDASIGVPYFDAGLGAKPRALDGMREIVRSEILGVPGVTGIISLEVALDRATRQLAVTYRASTEAGDVEGAI
jgi:hypothetical protein